MSYDPNQGDHPGAYPPPGSGYEPHKSGGYAEPSQQPLLLGEAMRQLPSQYFRVLTRPGAMAFAQERGKAAWNIIWVQVLMLAIISTIFSILRIFILPPTRVTTIRDGGVLNAMLAVFQAINSLGPIPGVIINLIWTVVSFFLGTGIYYLIAKAFGGRGTFKQYSYSILLIYTPLRIFEGLIGLIPIASINTLLVLVPTIYQIVLQVYMTMAVHRLSGGRAAMAVLIIPIVLFILACVAAIVIVALLVSHTHSL